MPAAGTPRTWDPYAGVIDDEPHHGVGALRAWDIFTALYIVVSCLAIVAVYSRANWWVVPVGALALWYATVGRHALRVRTTRWTIAYASGCVVLIFACTALEMWTAPLEGLVLVMIWWLLLPNRRAAAAWSALIAATTSAGLVDCVLAGRAFNSWSTVTRVIDWVVFPVLVVTVCVVLGGWADRFVSWGRDRVELVADLRDTEQHRIVLEREAAVAQERLRMAQEIHDTIAQDAAGLRLLVAQARRQVDLVSAVHPDALDVAVRPRPLPQTMVVLADAAETMLTQTRTLITTSMPPPMDMTFPEAVERLVTRFAGETSIAVDADVPDVPLGQESESVFMRCLQEGLSNVRKHSQATQVWVAFSVVGEMAVMTLTDNGVGMADIGRGFGLPGLAERVRLAGGSFGVESPGPSLGVTMRVRLPVRSRGRLNPAADSVDRLG